VFTEQVSSNVRGDTDTQTGRWSHKPPCIFSKKETRKVVGNERNGYRALVRKPDGKRPLRRLRRMWVDNIKMDLREIGWGGMDYTDFTQDRDQWKALVNTVMNLRVP
jgi:hypothetical protein